MLQAILTNKGGRNFVSHEMHWREFFTASEDSLTSTVFGTLLHLPRRFFWRILINACYECPIPHEDYRIEKIEYWPRWKASNSTNINFIEPDVFIQTVEFDLIVEAKRWDDNQQNEHQWETELIGYLNQFGEIAKPVFLIALGGLHEEQAQKVTVQNKVYPVIMCRWRRILNEVMKLQNEINKKQSDYADSDSLLSIIKDLIIGFKIHGYVGGVWLENSEIDIEIDLQSDVFKKSWIL